MHRRDRISSGSSVSSVVSNFTRKSRESAKENIPSRLPRGPTPTKEQLSRNKETAPSSKSRDHVHLNGSSGTRSEPSSGSIQHASATSSASSTDGEPVSPVAQTGSIPVAQNSSVAAGLVTQTGSVSVGLVPKSSSTPVETGSTTLTTSYSHTGKVASPKVCVWSKWLDRQNAFLAL